jgi:hypothetical protein
MILIGPKTDVRMPREQVGGCKPLGQGECVLFKCTCTAISGTFGLIGTGKLGHAFGTPACGPYAFFGL